MIKFNKYLIGLILGAFCLLFSFQGCENTEKKEPPKVAINADNDGYTGSSSCQSCHESEWDGYKESHHFQAMQHATDEFVLGDFDSTKVSLDGEDYLFYRDNGKYFVRTIGESGQIENMEIKYTFGFKPLQQYLVEFSKGRLQCLRISWDTEEKKWFHQYTDQEFERNDWLHWSQGGQNWNSMCASCHSTNLQKNYALETDSFSTTYSEITVGCESCHGPGKDHLNWAYNDSLATDKKILTLNESAKIQIESCAPCHARRTSLTADFKPGDEFHDVFRLQTINSELYHLDGQIKEEDYVYGSFLQSKMHAAGVKCTDCHNAHSYKLKLSGNALCLQCHLPETFDTVAHHFHPNTENQVACIDCHMTGDYFMVNDFRRDHSFRIPRPDQTLEKGTPNACNGCHTDKNASWAVNYIEKWYGKKEYVHFSNTLSRGRPTTTEDREKLMEMIKGDYPMIAKTTAMEYLSNGLTFDEMQLIWEGLNEMPADFIYEFLVSFLNYSIDDRKIALDFLDHDARLVRIGAALLLVDIDPQTLNSPFQQQWHQTQAELETYLMFNADFPIGRINLGNYYLRKGLVHKAVHEYEIALKKDSLIRDTYYKLAATYSKLQENEKARSILIKSINTFDNEAQAYYLLGLLDIEMGQTDIGIEHLEKSVAINPLHFKGWYNLSLIYYGQKNYPTALKHIDRALQLFETNENALYLKFIILKESGSTNKSNKVLNDLRTLFPENPAYR